MPYSVELYFDLKSEKKIKSYLSLIHEQGISNVLYDLNSRPHVSLAVYKDDLRFDLLIERLKRFEIESFNMHFENIAFFCSDENVAYLNPKITKNMLELHSVFHEQTSDFVVNEFEYYLPENWIPHCSIVIESGDKDFMKSLMLMKKHFKPLTVSVKSIALIRFRPIELLYEKSI